VVRGQPTVFFYLQPTTEPIALHKEFPGQSFPAVHAVSAIVSPDIPDGIVEAHDFVHEVAEELRLAGYLR
jgi:hypothetical protein